MNPPSIETFIDENGTKVARVPLNGRYAADAPFAVIDYDDLMEIHESGTSLRWCLCHNGKGRFYVSGRNPRFQHSRVNIVRELTKPQSGFIVRYENNDRTDLRRSNLSVERGNAKRRTLKSTG